MDLAAHALTARRDAWAWRLLATGASFVLFGLGGLLLAAMLPLLACVPGHPVQRRQRARAAVGGAFRLHAWFMRATRVLDISIEGSARLGRPGQLIVANHPSLIDVVFLLGLVPQANCIVKAALLRNPFTRGPMRAAGYIGNDGELETLERAAAALHAGECLLVFPEGTRTPPGTAPRFHRGAAAIALRGAREVLPVFVRVAPTTLTKAKPWYRIPPRRVQVQLRVGVPCRPAVFAQNLPLPIAARHLTDHLHRLYAKELATP